MRKERKYNYIYKTTCSVTKRYYIGMHSTDRLDDGYMGSGKRLWFSINYHGKENHKVEILEYCDTRKELRGREEEIVNEQLLKEDLCMNLMTGGQGGFSSEEHKRNFMSAHKKGRITLCKRFKEDEEFKIKFSLVGSKNIKKYNDSGVRNHNPFEGKNHSEETKLKMSKAKVGTGKGETNSQYGTCWITKDGKNKKIKKEDFETHINNGWLKGRK